MIFLSKNFTHAVTAHVPVKSKSIPDTGSYLDMSVHELPKLLRKTAVTLNTPAPQKTLLTLATPC